MLGLLSPEPRNDRYQTQARRSHVTPAISGLGSAKKMNRAKHSLENGARGFAGGYRQMPPEKPLRLAWLDSCGQIRFVAGRCIDITHSRIHVEVSEQIPLRTRVMLRADESNIAGSAFVKYVTPYEAKYIVVLETA